MEGVTLEETLVGHNNMEEVEVDKAALEGGKVAVGQVVRETRMRLYSLEILPTQRIPMKLQICFLQKE